MSTTRREVLAGIGTGVAAAAALRGFPAIAQPAPLKIGALISGDDHAGQDQMIAPYDAQMRLGLEMAVAEVNAAGGVLGRPLELVIRNDFGSPGSAVEEASVLLDSDGCEALVSGFVIATRNFLTRALADRPVPVIHGFGTEGTLCSPIIFHTGPTTTQSLHPLVAHLGDAAVDMPFTISDWTPSQRIVSNQLQTTIRPPLIALAGAALVTTPVAGFKPGEYRSLMRWAHEVGARTIYVTVPRPYAVNVVTQAHAVGVADGKTFVFLDFSEHQAAELPEGFSVITCLPMIAADPDQKVQDFVARAKAQSGGDLVTHVAYTHYTGILALKAAMEKAGEASGAAALKGLPGLTFEAPTGTIAFDAAGYATMPMTVATATKAGFTRIGAHAAVASGANAC